MFMNQLLSKLVLCQNVVISFSDLNYSDRSHGYKKAIRSMLILLYSFELIWMKLSLLLQHIDLMEQTPVIFCTSYIQER